MADDGTKIRFSGFEILQNCLNQNNVNTTQEELASLFEENELQEISVEDLAKKVSDKYGIQTNDSILETLSQIASNEGDDSVISKHDIELQKDKEFDLLLANMPELQESFTSILENIVFVYDTTLQSTVKNNGKIAQLWDKFKNSTGTGAGSDKAQAELDKAKALLEELKNDPKKLKEIYKEITGNELNSEEFEKLSNNEADFKNSSIIKSVSKYIQGQKQITNTVSTIASAATIAGLVASGIFTGGLSWLAAGAICVGAGTASYMIPQVIDGTTEKDGYSKTEVAQDVLIGGFNSLINTATLGSASAIGNAISSKVANQAVARFLTAEVVANSLGDTIAVGDYALEAVATRLDDWTISEEDVALFEKLANGELKEGDEGYIEALQKYQEIYGNNSEFSLSGLETTFWTSVAASTAAGAAGYGANVNTGSLISRLTQNSPRALQNGAKILSGGLTGYAAGGSAAFAGGATSYLLNTDFSDINAQDLLDASTENLATGTFAGAVSGTAFEAINVAAGIHASQGAKKFDINKLDFDYKNPDEVVSALRSGKITQSDLVEIFKSMPEIEVKALHRSLTKITHPDTCGPNNESYIINDAYTNYQDFLKTNTPIAQSETQANAQTAPKPPQTTAQQNENENPKAIVAQNQTLALNSENPTIESVVGFNSGMLSGMMAPVNAPLNSQNANENSGLTPLKNTADENTVAEPEEIIHIEPKQKNEIPKGSELDLQLKSLAEEASKYLAQEGQTIETMDEVLSALDIQRGELTSDKISHFAESNLGLVSARAKSADSIYSKLTKLVSKGDTIAPNDFKEALNMIGDAQGVRLVVNELSENIPDHTLTDKEITILQAKQNSVFVESLIKAIQEDKLHVYGIENYCGEDGIAYLTESDILALEGAYEDWYKQKFADVQSGKTKDFRIATVIKEVDDEEHPGATKRTESIVLIEQNTGTIFTDKMPVCETKHRDNGFTGTNINIVGSEAQKIELQFRGPEVNEIAQPEHVIYDCKQKKETVKGDEYKEIREVIEKIYKDKEGKLAKAYDRYFADVYKAAREIELGIRKPDDYPNINDYEVLVNELTQKERDTVSIEGVKEFCEDIEFKNKIKEQIKELNYSYEFDDKEINGISKVIKYCIKRLEKGGIGISKDNILDIMTAGEYYKDPSTFLSILTGMADIKYVGRACILAQLKNGGLINNETLKSIVVEGYSIPDFFTKVFNRNIANDDKVDYFKEVLKSCGFDDEKIEAITDIADKISKGKLSVSEAKTILSDIQNMSASDIQTAKEAVYKQKAKEIQEKILKKYQEIFDFDDAKINEIKEGLITIKENSIFSVEDIVSELNDAFKQLEAIEAAVKNNPTILQLYKDGQIDAAAFGIVMALPQNQLDIIKPLLFDSDLSKLGIFKLTKLIYLSEEDRNDAIRLIKENKIVNFEDALNIFDSANQAYSYCLSLGIDDKTASIMANIDGIIQYTPQEIQDIKNLLDSIQATKPSNTRTSKVVSDFLKENPNIDIRKLTDYIKKIDFDKLSEITPNVKEFEPQQFLQFGAYQFKNGQKTEFTKEDLSLDQDFTTYLMKNYLNADNLTELLSIYPCTSREVGEIPNGWLENVVPSDIAQATKAVYDAITNFQKDNDINLLSKEMSKITGKEVTIKKLGNGAFGTGYKISMQGADDMCLKIFNSNPPEIFGQDVSNIHGQHIEVQTGIFVNEHSSDFVKMYFGRVSPKNTTDGFLVTQFLSDDVVPDASVGNDTGGYSISTNDAWEGHNIINGKIIDFGAVEIDKDEV